MTIPITGEFAPSDGIHGFDLYDPQDIKAGNVNVVLQAIASGAFKGGSHATAPAGEIIAQVKTTTGAPTHSASEGTICWNSVDDVLYVNSNGTTGWTAITMADAELAAIAGLVSAADRLPYFTGAGTASLATFTAAGRALIDDADAATQRATLAIGSILPPTFPISCFPVSSNAFANVHVGAGANAKQLQGLGVAASIAADTIWRLQWELPMTLPPGVLKLRLIGVANAPSASKDAKIKVKWASVAVGSDYSSASLADEHPTTPDTMTWATTDGDKYKELKVTLDAATAAAGNFLVMDLTFLTASWTLDKVSTWLPSLIWE